MAYRKPRKHRSRQNQPGAVESRIVGDEICGVDPAALPGKPNQDWRSLLLDRNPARKHARKARGVRSSVMGRPEQAKETVSHLSAARQPASLRLLASRRPVRSDRRPARRLVA